MDDAQLTREELAHDIRVRGDPLHALGSTRTGSFKVRAWPECTTSMRADVPSDCGAVGPLLASRRWSLHTAAFEYTPSCTLRRLPSFRRARAGGRLALPCVSGTSSYVLYILFSWVFCTRIHARITACSSSRPEFAGTCLSTRNPGLTLMHGTVVDSTRQFPVLRTTAAVIRLPDSHAGHSLKVQCSSCKGLQLEAS